MNASRKTARPLKAALIAALIATGIPAVAVQATETSTDIAPGIELDAPASAPRSAATGAPSESANLPGGLKDFCFFARLPPASQKYKVVKNLSIGKGSYGSVTDILPGMAEYAQVRGADAIIEYTGSQRFGFWPWRVVRPVVRGIAVQWTEPKNVDCESIGGTKLSTIMSSGQPPAN